MDKSVSKANKSSSQHKTQIEKAKLTAEGETEGLPVGLIDGTGDGFGVGRFVGLSVLCMMHI